MQPDVALDRIDTRRAADVRVQRAENSQRGALLSWLESGLRPGRPGRLRAEFPTTLGAVPGGEHWIAEGDGAPLAHAFARTIEVRAGGLTLRLGMIGHVYTAPDARGRGLASACVEAAARSLATGGAALTVLWSDLHDFYARLGFAPVGEEVQYVLSPALLARAVGPAAGWRPEPAGPDERDWSDLEALYAAQVSCAVRAPGELRALAAGPDVALQVARRDGRAVAYAACGRGDDFADTVHEWAGEPDGVLACLAALHPGDRALRWLCGPADHPACARVRAAGGAPSRGCFALGRVADAGALWRAWSAGAPALAAVGLTSGPDGVQVEIGPERVTLPLATLLGACLGPGRPRLPAALPAEVADTLRDLSPLPLFVWGFDSV